MQTNHNQKAGALGAAAAENLNDKHTYLRRRYEVSDTTAMLVDCITDVSDLYDKIIAALATKYGIVEAESDARSLKYLNAVNGLRDLLHAELSEHFTDAVLIDARNAHADIVRI